MAAEQTGSALSADSKKYLSEMQASNADSQAFQAEMMKMQNKHQIVMQAYQAQKAAYQQIRA